MKINMNKISYLILCLLVFIHYSKAQSSGPAYIKAQLMASGVYTAPAFEFTTAYDTYNKSTANGTIKGLFMEGLPYSKAINIQKKTKLFCWYGVPNGLIPGQKVPAVILIHGGGGEAYTEWVDEWVNKGYIAIALSLINKLPDGTTETQYALPKQEYFFSDNGEALQDQWFYHAVGSVMLAQSLLRSSGFTSQVDVNHIGVTGISWGGINTTVVTGIDERIDFSIPVYGCAYLKNSPIYSNQYNSMSTAAKIFYDKNWSGELYLPLHQCPMLFIDGNKDLQFTLNIFDKTYDNSASPEKYLRVENDMIHGHSAGRAPIEIYDFADYVTGYRSTAKKPLEFTTQNIDASNKINYDFNYTNDVNQAVLYCTKDTLTWGKNDPNFIWLTKTATLVKNSTTGTVTATVPDDAQAYYVNVSNTTTGNISSSTLKYAYRFYDWYDSGKSVFNTPIANATGGTLTTAVSNPNTTGINTSSKTNSFVKSSGAQASLIFTLIDKIKEVSYLKNKLKIYLSTNANLVPDKKIRLTYYNSAVGETKSISIDNIISASGIWTEYVFDFTNALIPVEVITAGGFDRLKVYFAPEDSSTSGTTYYFDGLKGTINETYVAPVVYYPWLDYSVNPSIVNITKYRDLGGTYAASYDTTLDNIASPETDTNKATKFIKIAGSNSNAQIDYNFTDGTLKDASVTFVIRALFKPKIVSEINTLEAGCTGITIILKNSIGDNTTTVTQTGKIAYFSTINEWNKLSYTFSSNYLVNYDQFLAIFAIGYASPKNENGLVLSNEDFVYYVESIKATVSLNPELSNPSFSFKETKALLYPNPTLNNFSLSEEIKEAKLYNVSGKKVADYNTNQSQYNIAQLPKGVYLLKAILLNNSIETIRIVKE
jgi:dienelactone hydrolase